MSTGKGADAQSRRIENLPLEEFIRRVLRHNETMQSRLLELEIQRREAASEKGIFDPELVLAYEYEDNQRPNTTEERRTLDGALVFLEKNNIYRGGVETLVPFGSRVGFNYSLRDLRNNLQNLDDPVFGNDGQGEYATFAGLTVVQPLLKDAGRKATLAAIRVAASESEIAYQDYRRQMMGVISAAELGYWNLYFAQENLSVIEESARIAGKLVNDTADEVDAGRSSVLALKAARGQLAERQALQFAGRQLLVEASNAVAGYFSSTGVEEGVLFRATAMPGLEAKGLDVDVYVRESTQFNPDYLAAQEQIRQEKLRVDYARNQKKPRLDVRASYGLNGLGDSGESSWNDIEEANFPTWFLGVEMRVPWGNRRARNDFAAAVLREQQAVVALEETRVQITNAIDNAIQRVTSSQKAVESLQAAVDLNQDVLDSQIEGLDVGRADMRSVFDAEEDLSEARTAALEALVRHRRALLEVDLVTGVTLNRKAMEIPREDLEKRTAELVRDKGISSERYQRFLNEHRALLDAEDKSAPILPLADHEAEARDQPPVVLPLRPGAAPEGMEDTVRAAAPAPSLFAKEKKKDELQRDSEGRPILPLPGN